MIEQGFEPSKFAKVSKVLKEGSPPATAIVTLEEPRTKGSPNQKRTTLKFSRKPCEECSTKMTGWWLWEASARWECEQPNGEVKVTLDECEQDQ